jgi:hypothetical protein
VFPLYRGAIWARYSNYELRTQTRNDGVVNGDQVSTDKLCIDCGQPTGSVRRKRCLACRRIDHARAQRERRAAEAGYEASDHAERDSEQVIDLTLPGATSRPPSYDIPEARIPSWVKRESDDISDGRVLSPMARFRALQPDMRGVSARDRQDWVRGHRIAAAQNRASQEGSGPIPWDTNLERMQEQLEDSYMVDFSRRPDTSMPVGHDELGRPYPRQRGMFR